MAPGLRAPEYGATAQHLARIAGTAEQLLPADRRLPPPDAPVTRRASRAITEILIVDAADRADAQQGYPWGWEVIYGEAHRSGACQTRAQAQREAAIVLVLLKER